jgi:hypothetical protein
MAPAQSPILEISVIASTLEIKSTLLLKSLPGCALFPGGGVPGGSARTRSKKVAVVIFSVVEETAKSVGMALITLVEVRIESLLSRLLVVALSLAQDDRKMNIIKIVTRDLNIFRFIAGSFIYICISRYVLIH